MSFKFFVLKEKTLDHNISVKSHNLVEARKWCEENCKHNWGIEDGGSYKYDGFSSKTYRFAFEDHHESLTFKLIWGE